MRFFHLIALTCLLQEYRLLATGFPGEPDLGFELRITATAVLPLPDGRLAAAGVGFYGADGSSGILELVVLQPDGNVSQSPWVLPSSFTQVHDIDSFADGSFLISGVGRGSGGSDEARIARTEPGGLVDPEFGVQLGLRGEIRESVLLPGGRIAIAGLFTDPNRVAMSGIARLDPDGTIDPTFAMKGGVRLSDREGEVFTLNLLPGGKLLAGGDFITFDGVEQNGLVRLLPSGELDTTFRSPLRPGSSVQAMALQADGRVLIAGFLDLAGRPRSTVLRLEADGALDRTFLIPSIEIPSFRRRMGLVVDAEGRVIVSGSFTSVNGVRYRGIVRLSSNGIPDLNFAPFAKYALEAGTTGTGTTGTSRLALGSQGEIFHYLWAQNFENFDPGIMRLYGGDPAPARPVILNIPGVFQLVEGSRGDFSATVIGFPPPALQWFSNGRAIPGATNQALKIPAAQPSDSGTLSVSASNSLGSTSQQVANLLVLPKNHTAGEIDTTFRSSDPALGQVYSLCESLKGQLVVVALVAQDDRTRILRYGTDGSLDPTFWVDLDLLPPASVASANLLMLPDGGMLVGGRFGGVGGIRRTNLARLTADGSVDPGFADLGGASSPINALLRLKDGRYCVAGGFTNIQGMRRSRLAILKSDGAPDETFVPPVFSSDTQILQLFQAADGSIIAAGRGSAIEGSARTGLVKIGLTGQVDPTAFSSLGSTSVVAAAYSDGRIVAAIREPGTSLVESRVVRFLPDGQLDSTFSLPGLVSGGITTLTVDLSERVVASGNDYLSIEGTAFRPFLRFFPDGKIDPIFAREAERSFFLRQSIKSMMPITDGRLVVVDGIRFVVRLSEDKVGEPPRLVAPFVSRGALIGNRTALSAPVEGENLRFSWFYNGQLTTQALSFYLISAVSSLDFGEYSFVASNDFGSVTSAPARLFPMGSPPNNGKGSIAAKFAFPGDEVFFPSLIRACSAPIRFQWYRNDQPVRGGTTSELLLPSVGSSDSGYYHLVTSNPYGQTHGSIVKLSVPLESFVAEALDLPGARWVADDPQLWKTVTDDTSDGVDAVKVGPLTSDLSPWLQTRLVGPGTLTFRWKLGDPDSRYSLVFILSSSPGATQQSSTRTRTGPDWETVSVEVPSGVRYPTWVFKRGSISGTSSSFASLDLIAFTPKSPTPPTISRHPSSVTLSPGATLQLSVAVQSQLPIQFQWFRDHVPIPGASGQILEVAGVQEADSGEYEVRVSNAEGSVTSFAARVSVTQLPSPLGVGTLLPGGGLRFTLTQEPGRAHRLQTSDDLNEWFDLDGWTIDFTGTTFQTLDTRGATGAHRFYRAILEP